MADIMVEVFLLYLCRWLKWFVGPDVNTILLALHLMVVAQGRHWLAY